MRESEFVSISAQTYIAAVIILLLIPLPWLVGWVLAAFVHELCHYIAVLLCGGKITAIRIGISGAVLEAGYLSPWASVICCLAGPAGGLVLCLLSEQFPRLAVCGFLQSVYNLLPVYPLDAGRAVRVLCAELFRYAAADKLCRALEMIILGAMLVLSTWSAVYLKYGISPVLAVVLLLLRLKKIKIPCKSGLHAVQ